MGKGDPGFMMMDYPKQLKAEMGNGHSGFMMMDYPKQPWAEMGNGWINALPPSVPTRAS